MSRQLDAHANVPPAKESPGLLNKKLRRSRRTSGRFGEEDSLFLSEIEPRIVWPVV
jgi:hypothetical protein